jgi:uncharacterized membrane protein YcgQ (UPF0703/DUF1980 family)
MLSAKTNGPVELLEAVKHRIILVWAVLMKYQIAIWALVGFLLAGFWALFAAATFPSSGEPMRNVWTLVCITCPIAIAGMHHAISLYEVLVANAMTYGFVGLIVETMRKQLHDS